MGPLKVVKALSEHVYIKGINKQVRQTVRKCTICQMVKTNNERKAVSYTHLDVYKRQGAHKSDLE